MRVHVRVHVRVWVCEGACSVRVHVRVFTVHAVMVKHLDLHTDIAHVCKEI